jgi:hypothetical protein
LPEGFAVTKYSNLGEFLRDQKNSSIALTFAEVERIIGYKLPRSARYPAWWSNNPSNNVMTKVWLAAGFKTAQVDTERKKLVFRRVETKSSVNNPKSEIPGTENGYYPFYGTMKGLIRIPTDLDLTEPADPDWGKVYD